VNSRERVLTALAHREPDKVPVDFWAMSEVLERLVVATGVRDTEELLQQFGVDLRYEYGPSEAGNAGKACPDGSALDLWGVRRKLVTVGQGASAAKYWEVVHSPLADARTVADIESYAGWPDPAAWDFTAWAASLPERTDCARVIAGNRLDRTAQLKPAMYLRGPEQILLDLHLNPALAEALFEHIRRYFLDYNRRVFAAAAGRFDVFMMGDDFGTQNGPMMSVEMWRRFFREGFRQYVELAHSFGLKVMHHTCGSVRQLIPDFIDCGLDVLQSLQPQAADMDLAELKREFGRDLALHGSIDLQGPLVHGSPDDVRREVERKTSIGKPGGGFIISTAHNIQPDAPTENILALVQACHDFRDY
jgi:uroporphyrinogen decarboxylase